MANEDPFSVECKCEYCKDQRTKEAWVCAGKLIGGFIVTTVACELAIFAAPFALGALGFGAGGVRAVSWAARVHSWIDNVRKGSLFASMTSTAMTGALSPAAATGIRAVFQTLYVGGAATEAFLKKDAAGNPIVPKIEEELQNLVNSCIEAKLICGICKKRIVADLRGLCSSVCRCQ